MRSLLPLLLLVLPLAGCADEAPADDLAGGATTSPALDPPAPPAGTRAVTFEGEGQVNTGSVCITVACLGGSGSGVHYGLRADDALAGLDLTVTLDGTTPLPQELDVWVWCVDGEAPCSDEPLAQASGTSPLHVTKSVATPPGARLVVEAYYALPWMLAHAGLDGETFTVSGTLQVEAATPASA